MPVRFREDWRIPAAAVVVMQAAKLAAGTGGFLTEPDEYRYTTAFRVLKALAEGQMSDAAALLFEAQGRPLAVALYAVPAAAQYGWAAAADVPYLSSAAFLPLLVWNWLVHTLNVWLFYRFMQALLPSRLWAWTGTAVFAALTSGWVYLRHALPYEMALTPFLWVLADTARHGPGGRLFRRGSALAAAAALYPGYIPVVGALVIWLAWDACEGPLSRCIRLWLRLGAGGAAFVLAVEGLARRAGTSWITHLKTLASSVHQGSPREAPVFAIRYLWEVEGPLGMWLAGGTVLFLLHRRKVPRMLRRLWMVFFLVYVTYSLRAVWGESAVWYARLLKPWWPVATAAALWGYYAAWGKRSGWAYASVLLALLTFGFHYYEWHRVAYPKQVYWKYLYGCSPERVRTVSEYRDAPLNIPPLDRGEQSPGTCPERIAVNLVYLYPFDRPDKWQPFEPPSRYRLIFDRPHYLQFKAYGFEGWTPE
ncbi:MAG: hypothetical protein GXO27_00475, partial [Chlorobi bacterium]|nr:hypothetical protein [Chlorobiota bacterium]